MSKDELIKAVLDFFGDTSRSPEQTKDGLLEAAQMAANLAESIDDCSEGG